MTEQERENTIHALAQCDLVEFARIVNLALARRPDAQTENDCDRTKLILAQSIQTREDDGSWSRWSTSAIASADMSHYKSEWEFGNGEPFRQFGRAFVVTPNSVPTPRPPYARFAVHKTLSPNRLPQY